MAEEQGDFGLPRQPHPVVFDIGTAAANHGDLVLASRLGREIPEGVAIDAQGRPTRDPAAGLAGAILTFGGHKGYGLAFATQALGLLGGAAYTKGQVQDYRYLFVVFDPGTIAGPRGQVLPFASPSATGQQQSGWPMCRRSRRGPTARSRLIPWTAITWLRREFSGYTSVTRQR